jgi:hypothetical protein
MIDICRGTIAGFANLRKRAKKQDRNFFHPVFFVYLYVIL